MNRLGEERDLLLIGGEELLVAVALAGRATGRLSSHAVPGWHVGMFQAAGAALIADTLQPLLDRVDAAGEA